MIKDGKLKVFVYGTLKKGGHFAKNFDDHRVRCVPAEFEGVLYDAGWFPAAVKGDGVIHGEIHEYDRPEEILAVFDRIESFIGPDNPGNLYNREEVTVKTEDGEEEVSMYLYARNVGRMKAVEDGVWKI